MLWLLALPRAPVASRLIAPVMYGTGGGAYDEGRRAHQYNRPRYSQHQAPYSGIMWDQSSSYYSGRPKHKQYSGQVTVRRDPARKAPAPMAAKEQLVLNGRAQMYEPVVGSPEEPLRMSDRLGDTRIHRPRYPGQATSPAATSFSYSAESQLDLDSKLQKRPSRSYGRVQGFQQPYGMGIPYGAGGLMQPQYAQYGGSQYRSSGHRRLRSIGGQMQMFQPMYGNDGRFGLYAGHFGNGGRMQMLGQPGGWQYGSRKMAMDCHGALWDASFPSTTADVVEPRDAFERKMMRSQFSPTVGMQAMYGYPPAMRTYW